MVVLRGPTPRDHRCFATTHRSAGRLVSNGSNGAQAKSLATCRLSLRVAIHERPVAVVSQVLTSAPPDCDIGTSVDHRRGVY